MILLPPVSNKPNNGKWRKGQVKNPRIHSFGWFFTLLLCCFSANGALCFCRLVHQPAEKKSKCKYECRFFHARKGTNLQINPNTALPEKYNQGTRFSAMVQNFRPQISQSRF